VIGACARVIEIGELLCEEARYEFGSSLASQGQARKPGNGLLIQVAEDLGNHCNVRQVPSVLTR
jgi:hypothetical protein